MLRGANEMTFTDNVEPYSFMFTQRNPHSKAVSHVSQNNLTSLLNMGLLDEMTLSLLFDFLCLSKTLCFFSFDISMRAEEKGHAYTLSYAYIWEAILDYSSHQTHIVTLQSAEHYGMLLSFKPLCSGSF